MWSDSAHRSATRITNRVLAAVWERMLGSGDAACAATEWHSGGGQRVLIVAPHPDDELAGCGGTLLRHIAAGDRVTVAVITDGRRSRAIADSTAMAHQRRRESEAVARLTGVRLAWLDLPEGGWHAADFATGFEPVLEAVKPDLIYAPSRVDFHPEHRRVAHALAVSLGRTGADGPVRIFEVQVPLAGLENLVCPVSVVLGGLRAAVDAYESQRRSLVWLERRLRYGASRHGRPGLAEVFWQLPTGAYLNLHRGPPQHWPQAFRGLRNHALTDPWAYSVGRAERTRLAAAASVDSKHGARSDSTNSAPALER